MAFARDVWANVVANLVANAIQYIIGAILFGVLLYLAVVNVGGACADGGAAIFAKAIDDTDKYVGRHPYRAAMVAGLAVFLTVVIAAAVWHYGKKARRLFLAAKAHRALVDKVGVESFWPHTAECKKAEWASLAARASATGNRLLNVLGATGWETFGANNAPLHETVKRFGGVVRILLADPDGLGCEARAGDLDVDIVDYRRDILRSIAYCQQMKQNGRHFEVRLYHWVPTWKMVITHDTLWLQHYRRNNHVDCTPAFTFYSTSDEEGLYHSFAAEFERMWDEAAPVDLVPPPKRKMKSARSVPASQ